MPKRWSPVPLEGADDTGGHADVRTGAGGGEADSWGIRMRDDRPPVDVVLPGASYASRAEAREAIREWKQAKADD